jgi:hypothetical protein
MDLPSFSPRDDIASLRTGYIPVGILWYERSCVFVRKSAAGLI